MSEKDGKKKQPKERSEKVREIKQVYLSEDGNEETAVTSKIIEEEPASGHGKSGAVKHEQAHRLRLLALAVAMVFSIFVSMAVGIALALWDGHRTLSELNNVLFGHYVSAAMRDETATDRAMGDTVAEDPAEDESKSQDTDETESVSEAKAPAAEEDEVSDESETSETKDDEPEDYGMTMAGIEGFDSVEKAGADDEIEGRDDEEPETLKDPLEDYPLDFTTVDESYFTDALFIGDSRLQGFGFWSGLPATYYCATGFQLYKYDTAKVVQTEDGKVPIFDAMPYDAFTKIYIKVGLNELGYGTEENFEKKYAELIEKLREYEPRAVIYVHAILPVTEAKSATDKAHNNPNIVARNTALKDFAKTQKAYFLDAGPALSDEQGNLRPEMTSDGIHLKPEYMKIWREYLCEHAIVIE